MNASPDEPQDEFVFDEKFIAAAKFKEPPAVQRQGGRIARWRAARRSRAMSRKFGSPPTRRRRSILRLGPRTLTVLIVLALIALAVLLNYLDPFNLHPAPPKVIHVTVAPTVPSSN
jgi:hypothetical protein